MERSILVVDDDGGTVEFLKRALREAGYTVTGAHSAAAAIRDVAESPLKPGLLITDVMMPGDSGAKLADDLIALLPELRVLFITGFAPTEVMHHGALGRNFPVLAKPFKLRALLAAVAKALSDDLGNGKEVA